MSRLQWTAAVAAVLVAAATAAVILSRSQPPPPRTECRVSVGSSTSVLDLEQAANATTIAAIGKLQGLPDHAVTIALAAALQESGLHNLDHGDRDSLGLFQQRSSQGWGSATDIMNPRFAANAFYDRLRQVTNWQALAVNDAAQAVQRSGAPTAYAKWEGQARFLAIALTGQSAQGLTCRFPTNATDRPSADVTSAIGVELGPGSTDAPVAPARGWTVAVWLVGHAQRYGLSSVTFDGRRWTPQSGTWRADPSADSTVRFA